MDSSRKEEALDVRMELEHEGECIVLAVPDAVLGRTSASEIHVSHPLVSRRHCRFEATAVGVFVEDLGSSNGTYLNGQRLARRSAMTQGDVVQIGKDGPRFTLLSATVNGRDVAGDPDDDAATIIAGDPRAIGLPTRVAVAPTAAPEGEAMTRESPVPQPDRPQTTGSIPVATPIGSNGDSVIAGTVMYSGPTPEPPTQLADDDDDEEEDEATRMIAPPPRAAAPPRPVALPPPAAGPGVGAAPHPDDPATVFTPRPAAGPALPPAIPRSTVGVPTNAAAPPPARPAQVVAPAAVVPVQPAARRRGGGLWLGLLLGLLIAIALGVLTPLGPLLHGMAPWAKSNAETSK